MNITVTYRACDGARQRRNFKTLEGAQRFAERWIGMTPELGSGYAVSSDGIGTIWVEGCKLIDLFPKLAGGKA